MFRAWRDSLKLIGLLLPVVLLGTTIAAGSSPLSGNAVSLASSSAGQVRSRATSQAIIYGDENQTAADTEWHDLFDGLGEGAVFSRGLRTVEVNMNISGAPIDVRATGISPEDVFVPSIAHFDPSGGTTSFSFEFARPVVEQSGCHHLRVRWRSSSGASATVDSWLTVIRYRAAKPRNKEICE
jgi:hypothetical protein